MNWNDFVYTNTFKACMKAGCSEVGATNAACSALQKYKNNDFTKVVKLIDAAVVDAKKLIVKKSKNKFK